MKPSLMSTLLLLSTLLYEAHGIRLGNPTMSASNYQKIVTDGSSSNRDDVLATVNEVSPGINRKLMAKSIYASSMTTHSKNYKNDRKLEVKFSQRLVGKEENFPISLSAQNPKHRKAEIATEHYPDVIDVTGMDYSPAQRKPPIHN